MTIKKTVSVVITTHNRPELLERAIKSVARQDYKYKEIVVSDDCSDYDVGELISKIEGELSIKIKLRRNSRKQGACYTRNEGIKIASGEYIAGLDDDDEFLPNRLSYLMNHVSDCYSFITSNTTEISSKGEKLLFNRRKKIIKENDLLWENIVGTQVLVKRDYILGIGGFDTDLASGQDADMWIRLVREYGPALRLPLSTYLLHTEHDKPRISTSSRKLEGLKMLNEKHMHYKSRSQIKYANLKIEFWLKNNKLSSTLLKYLDINVIVYLFKIKIIGR